MEVGGVAVLFRFSVLRENLRFLAVVCFSVSSLDEAEVFYSSLTLTDQQVCTATSLDARFFTLPHRKRGWGGFRQGRIPNFDGLAGLRSDPCVDKHMTNSTPGL